MRCHGTHPALPTVLHDDGQLDLDGQRRLAATVAAAGVDGVVVLDPALGEVADLDAEERMAVVRAVREAVGDLPVTAGVGVDGDPLAAAQRAAAAGADALLVPLGTTAADDARADAVAALGLPWWLHHLPARAGTADRATTVRRWQTLEPAAVVVEEAPPGDLVEPSRLAVGPPTLGGLAGLFLLEELEAGTVGTIAGGAVPERVAEVVRRAAREGPEAATDAFLLALPVLRLAAGSPGVRLVKEAWRQRGTIGSARVRRGAPLATATRRSLTRRLRQVGVELQAPWPDA